MTKQLLRKIIGGALLAIATQTMAQTEPASGRVDLFMGADLHYKDITHHRIYDVLVNLTPGVKWHMGHGWQAAGQVLVPIYNDYGGYYKRVRLNMAVLSKEFYSGNNRLFTKWSGGWFGQERYGVDLKGMWLLNNWWAVRMQAGWTGRCSMANGWEASLPKRWTALGGAMLYLVPWNTQLTLDGGRFVFGDYGAVGQAMRHFKHCSVGLYAQYSSEGGSNGGFKVVMMIPPYRRKGRKLTVRPASNFRLTYNIEADVYANKMYTTDPEENEREGWFDRTALKWGANAMDPDFKTVE